MDSKNSLTNKITFILFIVAFVLITGVSALSAFSPISRYGASSFVESLLVFLFVPVIFVLGYYIKKSKLLPVKDLVLFIGLAFAIVALVNTIATWINYGLLHTLIYKETPIYYYAGKDFDVTKEAFALVNLSLYETSTNYFGLFPMICGAFLPGIFYLDKKTEKVSFIMCLAIATIGVVSLLSIGLFKQLLILVVVDGLVIAYKFLSNYKKVFNIVKYVIWGLVALAIVFYFLALINASLDFKFGGIAEKIFVTNSLMSKVSDIFGGVFIKDGASKLVNFFGLNPDYAIGSEIENIALTDSGIFEVELIKECGVIGVALFMIFLGLTIYELDREVCYSNDNGFIKVCLVSILFGYFVYCSLFYDATPVITVKVDSPMYTPILRSTPFLVMVGLSGTLFNFEKKEA